VVQTVQRVFGGTREMNKDHMIRVRVDKKTKEAANLIFKKHGINMSIAIRMYLHQIVNKAQQK